MSTNKLKITALALLCCPLLWATPKLIPTDEWLFEELNGLANRQVIQLDLSTFPLSQTEVKRALREAVPENQSDTLVIQRINGYLREKRDGFTAETVAHSKLGILPASDNRPNRFRNFSGHYDRYRTSFKQSFALGELDVHLQANLLDGQSAYRTRYIDYAGSYVALKWQNQWISVGQQSRFWGVGHTGSLILGNASRPMWGINIQRDKQTAFDTPWLTWLGKWHYQLFIAQPQYFPQSQSPKKSQFIGLRLSIQPTDYLTLSLAHTQQRGGKTETLQTVNNEPIESSLNQMSALDFRVRLMPLLKLPMSIYGQIAADDYSHGLPSEHIYLLGLDSSHNLSHRQTLNWFVEVVETGLNLGRRSGKVYEHSLYQDGYYHQMLPLGYPLGADTQVIALGANSAYRNNDITAFIQQHQWRSKLLSAKTTAPDNLKKQLRGIELGWRGDIPFDKYISLKLDTSVWLLKEKAPEKEPNHLGFGVKASIEF